MKKGFLQTFIVLGILGVFLIGGISFVDAQNNPFGSGSGSTYGTGSSLTPNNSSNTGGTFPTGIRDTQTTQSRQSTQYNPFGFGSGSTYGTGSTLAPNNSSNSGGSFPVNYNYNAGRGDGSILRTNSSNTTANPAGGTGGAAGGVTVDGASTSWAQHNDGPFEEAIQTAYSALLIGYSRLITWVVGLTGKIFDLTLSETTSSEGKAYKSIDKGVSDSWKIIRDLSNIILVFSLLYLGIKTILDGQGFAEKKVLVGIIMAAVLINFSLVFVKDIAFNLSNTIGLQIMEQSRTDSSFSASFMSIVNPQVVIQGQLGGDKSEQAKNLAFNSTWQMLMSYTGQMLMLSFVLICLGFIFIGVSLMLIYRFLIFIVLMIFSPIGLISTQIPWLKNLGKDWLEQLKKQSLFFPAFTLILYIVLYIVSTLILSDPIRLTLTDPSSMFNFVFRFILVIGFMVGLLILPGKIGMVGADLMAKSGGFLKDKVRNLPRSTAQFGRSTAQFGGRMAASGTARAGRYLLGNKLANKIGASNDPTKLKALQLKAQGNGPGAFLAQQRLRTSQGLRQKTYDVRNTKAGANLGIGKGIESWSSAVKTQAKKYSDRRDKDMKMFGFDKLADSSENKLALQKAEAQRDVIEQELKARKTTLENAKANPKTTDTQMKTYLNAIKTSEKKLEIEEQKVGKLKNIGEHVWGEQHSKKWRTRLGRIDPVRAAANKELDKNTNKKWREAGQSSRKKRDRASEERIKRDLTSPPVATT